MNRLKEKLRAFFRGENAPSLAMTAAVIAVAIILNVLVYVLDVNYGLYFTVAEEEDYKVSDYASEQFAEAEKNGKKIEILFCQPEDDLETDDTGKFVYETAKQIAALYPDLVSLDYVNIITMRKADGTRADFSRYLEAGETIRKNSVIFSCGENYKVVTDSSSDAGYAGFYTFDSSGNAISYNGEEVVRGMMQWVLADEHQTAYITVGHGETAEIGVYNMLICAGYNVKTLNLRSSEVPSDAGLVVISAPTNDFENAEEGSLIRSELARLRSYMEERGGNLFVLLDPYGRRLTELESFLSSYGITVSRTEAENGDRNCNMISDSSKAITTDGYTFVAELAEENALTEKISEKLNRYDTGSVVISIASALETDSSKGASPLLVTSSSAVTHASGERTGSSGVYTVAATSYPQGYVEGTAVTGRLFVAASVNFATADALTTRGYANRDFLYSLWEDLYRSSTPPYGASILLSSNSTLENLTMGEARFYTFLILLIPAALAVCGVIVTKKRKNR